MSGRKAKQRRKEKQGFSPVFYVGPVYLKNFQCKDRIIINRGGTRSGKTYSLSQLFINWLFSGQIEEGGKVMERGVLRVVRKYSATIKSTVMADFLEILETTAVDPNNPDGEKLYSRIRHNKVDRFFEYGERRIYFSGIDDPQKARGQKQDILYCNEANELNYADFHQLNFRTTYKVFIDFNPDDEDIWINRELEERRAERKKDVSVFVSTYLDNPFLTDLEVKEIQNLGFVDPELWQVFGKGEYGKITGLVFPQTSIRDIPESAELVGYGVDWGYSKDPLAVIAVWADYRIDEKGEKKIVGVYYDEIVHEKGMLNSDLDVRLEKEGVERSAYFSADNSSPQNIAEMKALRWNFHGATKGKDSILFGISVMKQYPIYITPRSINLQEEFQKYKWKVDRSGNILNEPIDDFNHGIDACRYLMMERMTAGKFAQKYIRPKSVPRGYTSGVRRMTF